MDVTCNRCGTVYEFEQGLGSTAGMTVKCTQCGHLFKVLRPSPPPPPPPQEPIIEAARWRVRRVDGSTHTLESLADLTSLIGAGQFGAQDQISRTGQIWKRLGEIAELAPLFERPPRARRMSEAPPPPPIALASPSVAPEAKRATGSEPPAPPPEATRRRLSTGGRFHVMGAEVDLARAPEPARDDADDDERATAPHPVQSGVATASPSTPAPAPSPAAPANAASVARAPADAEVDTDAAPQARRPSARSLVLAGTLLIAAGVGAAAIMQARLQPAGHYANAPATPEPPAVAVSQAAPNAQSVRAAPDEAATAPQTPQSTKADRQPPPQPQPHAEASDSAPETPEAAPRAGAKTPAPPKQSTPPGPAKPRTASKTHAQAETPAAAPAAGPQAAKTPSESRTSARVAASESASRADPLELVKQGEEALERGSVQAAQKAFQRALDLDPGMARARSGLGFVALEHNQPKIAVAYFRPAANHGHAEALIGLGDAFRRLNRPRDALNAYQTYLQRFPHGDRQSIAQHQSELLSEQLGSSP